MSPIFTCKNIFIHNYLEYKCQDIKIASNCLQFACLYNLWLLVIPLCQIWWEQAVSMTA